jgi:hypothetical protein
MSKPVVVCIIGSLLSAAAVSNAAELSLAAGVDAWSSMEVSSGGSEADLDTDIGFSVTWRWSAGFRPP